MKSIFRWLGMGLVLLQAAPAPAAIFCVTNSTEFLDALDQAKNNGQNDEIRLKPNIYSNGSTGFIYFNLDDKNLSISGGWQGINASSCNTQSTGVYNTVFDANFQGPNLSIDMQQGGQLTVSDLGFVNGQAQVTSGLGSSGVGLYVNALSSLSGDVVIERNLFQNNTAQAVAALEVLRGHDSVRVRNNVFEGNNSVTSTGNIRLNSYGQGVYFVNNTVINNSVDSTLPQAFSGVEVILQDEASGLLANNIFWGHVDADFLVRRTSNNTTGLIYLYHNNYVTGTGEVDDEFGNLSVDPQLTGSAIFAYVPDFSSPMYNAGLVSPQFVVPGVFLSEWSYGLEDLIGTNRVQDGRVDIGARESVAETPIFEDGFD
ncbi:hypothetical protein [Marinicella meishanensis]|uniref:hypothetical protein n=1 Tax=Marinicella meishanensis TaxID=2873263 RepID=UPI001CBF4F37|nr:hypothetical protein [Marinicella sp. NBU2979]